MLKTFIVLYFFFIYIIILFLNIPESSIFDHFQVYMKPGQILSVVSFFWTLLHATWNIFLLNLSHVDHGCFLPLNIDTFVGSQKEEAVKDSVAGNLDITHWGKRDKICRQTDIIVQMKREVFTYKWGLLQTCSVRCVQTVRRGRGAGRRWCSWWSESLLVVGPCCEWTGRASGSPESSPDPSLRCRSMTVKLPSLTPGPSSSLSW